MKKRILSFFLLTISFLWPLISHGQTVDLSTPRSTLFTHLKNLEPESYFPEAAAKTIYGLTLEEAKDKAIKLKYIYEGKGLLIDFSKIPNDPNYTDSLHFPIPKHAYKLFPYRLPEVYLEKYGINWYYSKKTVAKIDYIYNQIYPLGAEIIYNYVPPYFKEKIFGLMIWQWIGLLIVIFLSFDTWIALWVV